MPMLSPGFVELGKPGKFPPIYLKICSWQFPCHKYSFTPVKSTHSACPVVFGGVLFSVGIGSGDWSEFPWKFSRNRMYKQNNQYRLFYFLVRVISPAHVKRRNKIIERAKWILV